MFTFTRPLRKTEMRAAQTVQMETFHAELTEEKEVQNEDSREAMVDKCPPPIITYPSHISLENMKTVTRVQ